MYFVEQEQSGKMNTNKTHKTKNTKSKVSLLNGNNKESLQQTIISRVGANNEMTRNDKISFVQILFTCDQNQAGNHDDYLIRKKATRIKGTRKDGESTQK